jgi:hypothetical protein
MAHGLHQLQDMAKANSTLSHLDSSLGLRTIALFKGLKGLLVLAAGSGPANLRLAAGGAFVYVWLRGA